MELFDPETEFLVSKRETGNEWELFKENVRPLKRGRKIELLNSALKSHSHNLLGKSSLLHHRRFSFLFSVFCFLLSSFFLFLFFIFGLMNILTYSLNSGS